MKAIAITTAAFLAAGTYAFAQGQPQAPASPAAPGAAAPAAPQADAPFRRFDRADREALLEARIAAIQAGLRLTDQQRQHWPAVEQAIRSIAQDRLGRFEQMRQARETGPRPGRDFMERVERRADFATKNAEQMRQLSTALKPLWASLDERQQRLLPVLMRPAAGLRGERGPRHAGMMHHGWRGEGRFMGPRDGRGPGPR